MPDEPLTKLISLSDTNMSLANSADDIRGRRVFDSSGEEVGEIDDLLIDDREKRVRFMRIASGGFLGIGSQKTLIPIDAITRIDDKVVHINLMRDRVAGAPAYDPQLVTEDYYANIYGYYGLAPFWGPGYTYPVYPFFPR